ncbi:MAG: hypothetical protein IPN38_18640 [Flavobacteriales bacterium]|nr:hypothetical protein [Flavobacteriales bacterium]
MNRKGRGVYRWHMLPIAALASALLWCSSCSSGSDASRVQEVPCIGLDTALARHDQAILRDTSDLFQGVYPLAPALTCPILLGLQRELKDDSARYHYERLDMSYWPQHPVWSESIRYFERHFNYYALLATSTHWNHDQKITALKAYQQLIRMRPMICTTKAGYYRLEAQDENALRFLIHVLEGNPLWISGSENSTIHGVYMFTLMETLDLLTKEHALKDRTDLRGLNDLQYEQMTLIWRGHLKKR